MKKAIELLCASIAALFLVSCNNDSDKPLPPTPDTVEWPSKNDAVSDFEQDFKAITSLTIKTVSAKEMQTILDAPGTRLIGTSGILTISITNGEATIATTAKKIIMPASADTFCRLINMTSLNGLELLDYSNTTSMFALFANCEKIQSLDLSSLNTAKVEDATDMFEFCYELKSIKLGDNFNLDKVKKDQLRYFFWLDRPELWSNPMNIIGCPDSQKNTIKSAWTGCDREKSALSFDGKPAFED